MTRLRAALVFGVIFLAACSHHKQVNQAQAEAGKAPVSEEAALTGESAPAPTGTSPRALPFTQTPASATASVAKAPPPAETPAPAPASAPPLEPPATPPAATPSSTADSSPGRLNIQTPSPVLSTNNIPTTDSSATQLDIVVVLQTSFGRIVIELDDTAAPKTCENFRKLVAQGFYDHTLFHRVIPNFVIQGGDPNSKSDDRSSYGQGGPSYTVPAEIKLKHDRGAVAMARLPDTVNPQRESNGSQFYICIAPCPSLDDQYTVFGHVIKGMDVAVKIANQPRDNRDDPLSKIEMEATLEPKAKALEETASVNP